MTKPRTRGWRDKLAEWADRLGQVVDDILPGAPVPVPVPVRPDPRNRPRRR